MQLSELPSSSLHDLLKRTDEDLHQLCMKLWRWAVDILDAHRNPFFTNHMAIDHGPNHLCRVVQDLALIAKCGPKTLTHDLGPTGLFLLLSATALHDIGMYFGFHLVQCTPQDLAFRTMYPGGDALAREFLPCEIQHGVMKRFLRRMHGEVSARVVEALADERLLDLTKREEALLKGDVGTALSYIVRTYSMLDSPVPSEVLTVLSEKQVRTVKAMLSLADFMHLDHSRTTETSIRLIIFYIMHLETIHTRLDSYTMEYIFRDEFGLDPIDFLKHFFNYYVHSVSLAANRVDVRARVPDVLPDVVRAAIFTKYHAKMSPGIHGTAITALKAMGFKIDYDLDFDTMKAPGQHLEMIPYWLVTYLFAYIHDCVQSADEQWYIPLSVIFLLAYSGLARDPATSDRFFTRCRAIHEGQPSATPWDVLDRVLREFREEVMRDQDGVLGKLGSAEHELLERLDENLRGNQFSAGIPKDAFLKSIRPPNANHRFDTKTANACLKRLEQSGCAVMDQGRLWLTATIGSRVALKHITLEDVYPERLRMAHG